MITDRESFEIVSYTPTVGRHSPWRRSRGQGTPSVGRWRVTVVPSPTRLVASIRPPRASAMVRAMGSPSPASPRGPRRRRSARRSGAALALRAGVESHPGLDVAQDHGEEGSELVGDVGEELRPRLEGALCRCLGGRTTPRARWRTATEALGVAAPPPRSGDADEDDSIMFFTDQRLRPEPSPPG